MAAFTYGPVAADLVALAAPSVDVIKRLGGSLGYEWVASLVEIDRPVGLPPSELANYLKQRWALRPGTAPNPFAVRRGQLSRPRPRPIPAQLLADFTASERGRLESIATTIEPLVRGLLAVANGKPWQTDRAQERAAALLTALGQPITLRRFHEPNRQTPSYTLEASNLYTRALLEIVELYNDQPALALCASCKRLFVPRRYGQKHCQRLVWPFGDEEAIAGCRLDQHPPVGRARLDARQRRNEYARLQMRLKRRTQTHGPDHQDTTQARLAFEQWKNANPVPRGRPENPMPLPGVTPARAAPPDRLRSRR